MRIFNGTESTDDVELSTCRAIILFVSCLLCTSQLVLFMMSQRLANVALKSPRFNPKTCFN